MKKQPATKKQTRGGARKGAGVKPRFNTATTRISVTVPADKQDEIKERINLLLLDYIK